MHKRLRNRAAFFKVVSHLPDLTAKCPKSIMEEVDEQFVCPKKFLWTAVQRVPPLAKKVPKCVLLWGSSFHFSQSLGQFYSSNQGAPRFPYLKVWEVKYVWSQGSVHNWYLSEMLSEVYFYRSWREFVKPCALTCCLYIIPVREWCQEPRLPCLSSRCPACYKCFSVTFCASFPPCPWGGDDKTCLIRASARIDETCVEPSWNSAWPLVSSQQV